LLEVEGASRKAGPKDWAKALEVRENRKETGKIREVAFPATRKWRQNAFLTLNIK
jgi:hypothetical protein